MLRDDPTERRWRLALLVLASALAFLVLHPYRGMVHDGRLYTVQALSHLRPELYGNDIFLRLGSQDDFTIFSRLHAVAISWLGIEPAAAFTVAIAIGLFVFATWTLARTMLPPEGAAMAVLLVLVVPGYYGSARVFHYIEEFVTPRQLAEGLVLLSIAAWLTHRKVWAVAATILALFIHPIIAVSGPSPNIPMVPAPLATAPAVSSDCTCWRGLGRDARIRGMVAALEMAVRR